MTLHTEIHSPDIANVFLTHCSQTSKSLNQTITVNINNVRLVFNPSHPDNVHKFIVDNFIRKFSEEVENHEN